MYFLTVFLKPGKLEKIDFEDETQETFGVGKIEEFTQHQLIDLYACVECGRCTNMCPATGTGKVLSPMDLILKMRDHLTEKGAVVTSKAPWVPTYAFSKTKGNQLAMMAAGQGGAEAAATAEYNPAFRRLALRLPRRLHALARSASRARPTTSACRSTPASGAITRRGTCSRSSPTAPATPGASTSTTTARPS